jgi:hypothetical protein
MIRLITREAESRLITLKPDLCQAIVQVLDDLHGGVDAGGFRDGFHEGIVPLIAMDCLESV